METIVEGECWLSEEAEPSRQVALATWISGRRSDNYAIMYRHFTLSSRCNAARYCSSEGMNDTHEPVVPA